MSHSTFIPLESIQIASPCQAEWKAMQGDERARFCQSCQKNVYNLAAMTRLEAEQLIKEKEGRLCLRMYRRADGTVITSDCPVGLATSRLVPHYVRKRPNSFIIAGVMAGVLALSGLFGISWGTMSAGSAECEDCVSLGQPLPSIPPPPIPPTPSTNNSTFSRP